MRYKKLPGHRRGLINGASAWLAPDHILLVRSQRFKEEYKRYYLRDIQAIAVAKAGRFHVSSRGLVLLLLWLIALAMSSWFSSMTPWVWLGALVLAIGWLLISADSCYCRIYTAVSSDPLPSVYRNRTARRFLAVIEPRIREMQGELDPAWMEAVGQRAVGPETVRDAVRAESFSPSPDAVAEAGAQAPAGRLRTVASDLFLLMLLLEAGADVVAFSNNSSAVMWTIGGLMAAQIVAAVFLFIDRNRGRLRSPVHKVAIAKLIWLTLLFYSNAIVMGTRAQRAMTQLAPANDVLRGMDAILSIAFVAAGLFLTYRDESETPTSLLGN
jgi:hypothetical protein